jgi:DNA-binding transcriptional ArsR family regulator
MVNRKSSGAPGRRAARLIAVSAQMPDQEMCRQLADFFSAFADKTRVRIIAALQQEGELAVNELSGLAGISESAVSHQLKLLRLLRLVASRSEGRVVYYRLDDAHIAEIMKAGSEHIKEMEANDDARADRKHAWKADKVQHQD